MITNALDINMGSLGKLTTLVLSWDEGPPTCIEKEKWILFLQNRDPDFAVLFDAWEQQLMFPLELVLDGLNQALDRAHVDGF